MEPTSLLATLDDLRIACVGNSSPVTEGVAESVRETTIHPTSSTGVHHLELRDTQASGSKTAATSSATATEKSDSSDGSPLDVSNQANKEKARSLLVLTVCLVAGVAWF